MPVRVEAHIRDIQIQPFKGGGPLTLENAIMTPAGLETVSGGIKDHFLVAVTEEVDGQNHHNFFTQRVQIDPNKGLNAKGDPRLALIRPEDQDGQLILKFNNDQVLVPHIDEHSPDNLILVQVWEHRGQAIEVPILSEWLSDNLGKRVRVAYTGGPWNRMARQNFQMNDNPLRAQDGYPVHTVAWEDVLEIFGALGQEPDANRFRYQLLIEGLVFRSIHTYASGEINQGTFSQPKPCGRCEVTGIDQDKGEFSSLKPLAGLAKLGEGRWIRENGNKEHVVGENWLPQGRTPIQTGDLIVFTQTRETPLEFEPRKPKRVG